MKHFVIFFLTLLLGAMPSLAQKANIGFVFPTSGTRGGETIVEIGGQGILNSQSVLISGKGIRCEVLPAQVSVTAGKKNGKRKGKKQIITDEDNLQLEDRMYVKLIIDPEAELGLRDIKLVSAKGMISNRLYFEVVDLPSYVEKEPNDSLSEANIVPAIPVVINGQVERGGRDFYCFSAKKDQHLVAEVYARHFVPFLADAVPGWFQAVIALYDEQGREVAFCDDYNLAPDPVIFYTIPKDGQYTISIQDSIFRGREDFVYRIALGEIPYVKSIFPLGAQAGQSASFRLMGEHLKKQTVKRMMPKEEGRIQVRLAGKGGLSNPVTLAVSQKEEIIIPEDVGDDKQSAKSFHAKQVINAKIEHDGDEDWYIYEMKEGESIIFDVEARRLGSPIDARLCVFDNKGKLITECDDSEDEKEGMLTHHADPQLFFTSPKSGRYYLRLTDTQNKYGEDFAYRLTARPSTPSFSLRVEPSAISVPQGGTAHFSLIVVRENNYKGDIELKTSGLPKGFVVSEPELTKGTQPIKMTITAPLDADLGQLNPIFEGIGSNETQRKNGRVSIIRATKFPSIHAIAQPVESMLQAFYITHLLPTHEFRMDVIPAQEFQISFPEKAPLQLKEKKEVELRVEIHRMKGFNEEIQLAVKGLPKWVEVDSLTVPAGQKEAVLRFSTKSWKKSGVTLTAFLTGTVGASTKSSKGGKNMKADIVVNSPCFRLITPQEAPPEETQKTGNQKKVKK